jgi:hypothetical protein
VAYGRATYFSIGKKNTMLLGTYKIVLSCALALVYSSAAVLAQNTSLSTNNIPIGGNWNVGIGHGV